MAALADTTELLRLLSDPTRVRLLWLLAHEDLTVAELTGILQLAQSRVSTHLGKLREAGLVRDRRAGSSSYYGLDQGMPESAAQLWELVRAATDDAVLARDLERAREVVRARLEGMSWADAVAGQMERHYSPGRTWEATARGLLGLCRLGDVLDVASGDGALAELIAPRADSVTCLDQSERVIEAARRRLRHLPCVRFVVGDMHALPFESESFDAVLLMNCLTYAERPGDALREVARVLRPGGQLCGVTLRQHEHARAVEAYDHVQLGFRAGALRRWLGQCGLEVELCEVTSREARSPHFEVMTVHARRPARVRQLREARS